jgi:integrase
VPRPRTGSVFPHGDHWDIQITYPGGGRSNPMCQPAGMSEAKAREKALRLTQLATKEAVPKRPQRGSPEAGEFMRDYADRWCNAREERGLTSAKDDRGRLRKWVFPTLGDEPIAEVTRIKLERLVEELDENVRAGLLSWKTARNTWGVVSKMFDDACRSKVLALRVRGDNPAEGVRPPDEGVKKSKAYLYPSEALAVLTCERVPIRWRQLFAAAIYTYTREGELEALEREDIDLDHFIIHVHRAIDRRGGKVKATKTNNPRHIPIEPALVPLMRLLCADRPSGRVVDMPPACDLSPRLRQYLKWAGVTRAELFADDATRKNITFHDLRATGITWMAIRGDEPLKIMQRAGHEDFQTTMGYVREAENLAHPVGEPFPPLPSILLVSQDESQESPATWGLLRETTWKKNSVPSGIRTRVTALKGLGPGPD